jgi:hypothetical protein
VPAITGSSAAAVAGEPQSAEFMRVTKSGVSVGCSNSHNPVMNLVGRFAEHRQDRAGHHDAYSDAGFESQVKPSAPRKP